MKEKYIEAFRASSSFNEFHMKLQISGDEMSKTGSLDVLFSVFPGASEHAYDETLIGTCLNLISDALRTGVVPSQRGFIQCVTDTISSTKLYMLPTPTVNQWKYSDWNRFGKCFNLLKVANAALPGLVSGASDGYGNNLLMAVLNKYSIDGFAKFFKKSLKNILDTLADNNSLLFHLLHLLVCYGCNPHEKNKYGESFGDYTSESLLDELSSATSRFKLDDADEQTNSI